MKNINTKAKLEWWVCPPCGYIYDPKKGDPDGEVKPGTPFEDLPNDWYCPLCGLSKDVFEKESEYYG